MAVKTTQKPESASAMSYKLLKKTLSFPQAFQNGAIEQKPLQSVREDFFQKPVMNQIVHQIKMTAVHYMDSKNGKGVMKLLTKEC